MDSRVPAPPSKPLHNFDLPITLRWSKLDGNAPAPGGVNRQLPFRHVRSPPRRPKTVFPASLLETLSGGSVSSPPPPLPLPPPPPRRQSSSGEISSRQSPFPGGGFQTKQTPIRGDSSSSSSSKPSLQAQERKKPSAVIFGGGGGGEPDQQMLSWFRGQAARSFPSRDLPPLEPPSKKTDQSALMKHSRNNYPFDTIKNGAYSSSSTSAGKSAAAAAEKVDEKKKSKGKQVDGDPGRIIKKSKIVIKIPCKNNNNSSSSNKAPPPPDQKKQIQNPPKNPPPAKIVTGDQVQEDKGKNVVVDDETKIWNLRPRKTTPFKKSSSTRSGKNATVAAVGGGGADKGGGGNKVSGSMPERNKAGGNDNQTPPPPPKNEGGAAAAEEKKADGGGEVKKKEIHKKPTLTIALTKREIEEDIYALTGAKPARRPRKRPKNVQKQLDMVFPGLWLVNN
ncbi:hypothetical protein ABFX02_02G144600 [Erythranthe guttata]